MAALSSAPAEWDDGTERELSGYRVRRLRGGWDVTAPDGTRLLAAAGPVTDGTAPAVPPDARYDAALLDLLGYPAQLGWLRARGAVHPGTLVAAAAADHRAFDARELARYCEIWRAALPRDGATLTVPAPVPTSGPRPGRSSGRPTRPGPRNPAGCWCSAAPAPASQPKPSGGWPPSPR